MIDDLVKRLRDVAGVIIGAQSQNLEEDYGLAREAADRIETLETNIELQLEWYISNKRRLEARIKQLEAELHSCFHRIEELQAALREIVGVLEDPTGGQHVADMRRASNIARKALEGKDD